jgi:peptide/nickel transport system substrate-binding protein
MSNRRTFGLVALGAAGALTLAACGSGGSGSTSGSTASFGQAATSVVNPSSHKGGTITYDSSSTFDSTDPGNTYYAHVWNFDRLYALPLMTYDSVPGAAGNTLVPGLATAPGTVSSNGLTWTYHLKPNVKFSTGATITSTDVKYAIERTFAKSILVNGPSYYQLLLGGNAASYKGPYTDKTPGHMGLTAVSTPNPTTIVFHLAKPFADFNYVVAIPQSAPVPPSADSGKNGGANYQLHVVSSGPYMFQSYTLNKQLVLVPNPHWSASTVPGWKQLASKIVVNFNVNANDIDNRLLAGDIQMDVAGTGVQAAARSHILTSSSLKQQADDPITGFMWFFYLNTKVAPLNNVNCRQAIEFAADKTTLQDAVGGSYGGSIASTAMPPTVIGYKSFDYYHALSQPSGDLSAAKASLTKCGHSSGFSTTIGYRSDRPREVATATALQAGLNRVGIKASLKGFPSGTYYSNFCGSPAYVHSHDLGICAGGWAPDWPDAWGWFKYIEGGDTISPAGNTNIAEENDPLVNSLLTKFVAAGTTPAQQATYANQIDQQVMKDAVMLPEVYARSLLYRSPLLSNVFVQKYYGMYNYSTLGCLSNC